MKTENKSIIGIGIDQGIANCGYSVVKLREDDELEVLTSGTIVTKSTYPLSQRCLILFNEIKSLVEEYGAEIIGCEKLFFNPRQSDKKGGRNKSASIVYTNMATGLLYLIAGQYQIPIKEFVPGTVKKALTGNGRAEKEEVEEAVIKAVVHTKEITEPNLNPLKTSHESDAVAIGITTVKYFQNNKDEVLKEHKHKKPRIKKGVK